MYNTKIPQPVKIEFRTCLPTDYDKGFLALFKQLNGVDIKMTFQEFKTRLALIEEQSSSVYVYEKESKIIATGKILLEYKFYDKVGHIEDIIVDEEYRGQGLGKEMIEFLLEKAFANNCYKVILECNDNVRGFYEKLGFKKKGSQMVIYR